MGRGRKQTFSMSAGQCLRGVWTCLGVIVGCLDMCGGVRGLSVRFLEVSGCVLGVYGGCMDSLMTQ